jgi:hypothetical protein
LLNDNWSSTSPDQIFGTSESRRFNRRQVFFIALAAQQKSEQKTSLPSSPIR